MINELLARRVVIVLGKGGVGKSSLSAALAKAGARNGWRVLVMECDSRSPIASIYGLPSSYEPAEAAPGMYLMTLDGRHALEQYLRIVVPSRLLLKAVFSSRLYQFFVQAAPGLRELMALGKVYYEADRDHADGERWDTIIVDAPASGQALSLLRMPRAARSTFGESIVGKESSNISAMLADRARCVIVQVTTADSLAVAETIETEKELTQLDLAPGAIFFNRVHKLYYGESDVAAMMRRRAPHLAKKKLTHLGEIARAELRRAQDVRAALARVRGETQAEMIETNEHPDLSGAALIDRLAEDLMTPAARPRPRRASARS
jgi:anion-transporting  ArsA/GET3 family ATPase